MSAPVYAVKATTPELHRDDTVTYTDEILDIYGTSTDRAALDTLVADYNEFLQRKFTEFTEKVSIEYDFIQKMAQERIDQYAEDAKNGNVLPESHRPIMPVYPVIDFERWMRVYSNKPALTVVELTQAGDAK